MATLRFVILQVILIAALVAAWMAGPLANVFGGESKWFVAGVAVAGAVGLILTALGRTAAAAKLQDLLPIVAVIAMQGGILGALDSLSQYLITGGDSAKGVGFFFFHLSTALYVSIAALASYFWLRINLWLCHGE